jgi:mannose-6-phosphate isomerase
MAESAIRTLRRFLETPTRGLWYDRLTLENEFVSEPAPASSLYHIVAAARELAIHCL